MSEINVKKVTFGENGYQVAPGLTGFRNKIMNGCFQIWQRGVSQTYSGYGSDDRWESGNVNSTKTHNRQTFTIGQIDVPGNPMYYTRTVVSSIAGANSYVFKAQRIEDVTLLSGKTVTISFFAKSDSSKYIAIELAQVFGSGGSPSPYVGGIGSQKFLLSTTWNRYTATINIPSVSGKTLGTDNNSSTVVTFWFDAGSSFDSRTASLGQQSGTFDIANVQLEEGSVATDFEQRPYGLELALCQRYYQQYQYIGGSCGANDGTTTGYLSIPLCVAMRTEPSYNSPVLTLFGEGTNFTANSTVTGSYVNGVMLALSSYSSTKTTSYPILLSSTNPTYMKFSAEL